MDDISCHVTMLSDERSEFACGLFRYDPVCRLFEKPAACPDIRTKGKRRELRKKLKVLLELFEGSGLEEVIMR